MIVWYAVFNAPDFLNLLHIVSIRVTWLFVAAILFTMLAVSSVLLSLMTTISVFWVWERRDSMVVRITFASLWAGTNATIFLCESEIAVIPPLLTPFNNNDQSSLLVMRIYLNLLKVMIIDTHILKRLLKIILLLFLEIILM